MWGGGGQGQGKEEVWEEKSENQSVMISPVP